METNSLGDSVNKIAILESQIRECFGRVVYSHKTQEKCADIVYKIHTRIKLVQITLSALVTTSILVKIIGDNQISLIIGAVLSCILFGLNAYTKDYDLGEIAQKHTTAANDLWNIRESYFSMLTDIAAGLVNINDIITARDNYQQKLSNIYTGSPRTNNKAYKLASKALQQNEELTFSDKEIDAFLPSHLRKNVDKATNS